MTDFSLDGNGQARLALQDILRDYGIAGIDDDALIDRHLPDLLPDAPREAGLLRAAAAAKVGHLLTDRFTAQMPPEAAIRDVAAILATRTAFDTNACLWVVAEYATVLGRPVSLSPTPSPTPPIAGPPPNAAPAKAPNPTYVPPIDPTRMDMRPAQAYQPGRAGPVAAPVPGPYGPPEYSGVMAQRPARSKVPIVIGIVVALAVIATVGIAFVLRSPSKCTSSTCTATTNTKSTHKPAKTPTPTPKTTPSSTTPSPPASASPPTSGKVPSLADLVPADIDVSTDNNCTKNADSDASLAGMTAFYYCAEPDDFNDLPDMTLTAYQFGTANALAAGLASFNTEVHFKALVTTKCPAPKGSSAAGTWDRKPVIGLGVLECYTDTDHNVNYVWTDTAERTLMIVSSPDSFSDLSEWWENQNNNSQPDN